MTGCRVYVLAMLLCLVGCSSEPGTNSPSDAAGPIDAGWEGDVTLLETFDTSVYNGELVDGEPTMDIAFYVTEGGPFEWPDLDRSIRRAQLIFGEVGVQLRVSAALRIQVPDDWQQLDADASDVPTTPEYLETDLYAHLDELRTRLTQRNESIIRAIVSYFPEQAHGVPAGNTIHVLAVNEAPISYYEWTNNEWVYATAPTGGLSFPPYAYADRIPQHIRGIITLSLDLGWFRADTKTLAHEIGHKAINVSHEGVGVCPAFAADGEDLMLYGDGERIPSGAEGRWHQERLQLSPFIYRLEGGTARFVNTYSEGGVYTDPLYGAYVVDPPCPGAQP